jgi:hypothetical protein
MVFCGNSVFSREGDLREWKSWVFSSTTQ